MQSMLSLARRAYRMLPPPPSTNLLYRPLRVNPYKLLPNDAVIFDIGSKGSRGRYAFGPPPNDARIVCVDIAPGPGVDLVADAHNLATVPTGSVDCVVTISVLEHVRYPWIVIKEIHRILKPGGIVYVNVPFVFPFHADPDDFYRFSCTGLEVLCEDFERLDSGFNRGPASTMHHLLVHFCSILTCFGNQTAYNILVDLFRWLFFWIKYLDKVVAFWPQAKVIHAGSYFIGRKPAPQKA